MLIVGQGLAGSLLAWELINRQCRVLVVDAGDENASQVAAGLINPVTGQRLFKHPSVAACLQTAFRHYRHLGEVFGQPFLVEQSMLRILQSEQEYNFAIKRLAEPDYQPYLSGLTEAMTGINAPYRILQQQQTGYLQTRLLLHHLRLFLESTDSFRQIRLAYDELMRQPVLQWQSVRPGHIVFCEGYQGVDNPWFGGLPFRLVKGEILACEATGNLPDAILNYGKWLIPQAGRQFKTGAGFETRQLDLAPTAEAKAGLLAELAKVCTLLGEVRVKEHKAGIRPATSDKQPLLGTHPRDARLHIFNGFGSRGSLTIPWCAERFADWLLLERPLPEYADVRRYYETHFPA